MRRFWGICPALAAATFACGGTETTSMSLVVQDLSIDVTSVIAVASGKSLRGESVGTECQVSVGLAFCDFPKLPVGINYTIRAVGYGPLAPASPNPPSFDVPISRELQEGSATYMPTRNGSNNVAVVMSDAGSAHLGVDGFVASGDYVFDFNDPCAGMTDCSNIRRVFVDAVDTAKAPYTLEVVADVPGNGPAGVFWGSNTASFNTPVSSPSSWPTSVQINLNSNGDTGAGQFAAKPGGHGAGAYSDFPILRLKDNTGAVTAQMRIRTITDASGFIVIPQ